MPAINNYDWKNKIPNDFPEKDDLISILQSFISENSKTLERNISERWISYKLCRYLESIYQKYDVDPEYNLQANYDDRNYIIGFISKNVGIDLDPKRKTNVTPDIIVHSQDSSSSNYLAIEIKRKIYADRKSEKGYSYRDYDKQKLKAYTNNKKLHYDWAMYLEFNKDEITELEFFKKVRADL
jgi:hypothetical protein